MATRSGGKRSKKAPSAAGGPRRRAARLEKALAAGMKREAKAASRLEAAQLEVAVLRMALAEVVGEVPAEPAPAISREEETPAPSKPAARPRRTPATAAKPAATPARARRAPRPGPPSGASDR